MSEIADTKALAEAHGLEFTDCGGGHVQVKGHGVLINYWPTSKSRTAHIVGGAVHKHCNPYDVIRLCTMGTPKPKAKMPKDRPPIDLVPVETNPAGVQHFYIGKRPPWDFPSFICCASDDLRIRAYMMDVGRHCEEA